jgi:hypothetical protein
VNTFFTAKHFNTDIFNDHTMNRINKRGTGQQSSYRRESRERDQNDYDREHSRDTNYAPYRSEHDEHRNDWNRSSHYNDDWYQAQNRNQPPYPERNEEWYRHTYGLPAGNRRMGQRHDIAQWGNPSFTQNTTNRQYDRMNDNQTRNEQQRNENSIRPDNDYSYNRYYGGDLRSWKTADNDRNWGDNSNRYSFDDQSALHRGKGPKGYARSDERIKDDINDRLTDDAHIDASDIDVTVEKGEVTLTGTVPDRWGKRRAEDIAELVSGVTNVENRIRVKSEKNSGSTKDSNKENGRTTSTGSERRKTSDSLN